MTVKVLLLNLPKQQIKRVPGNMTITQATIAKCPTLHDFHAIITDTAEIFGGQWWEAASATYIYTSTHSYGDIQNFRKKVKEQIETGGITFCFSSSRVYRNIRDRKATVNTLDNYFFCPIDLGIVSSQGDTFYPKFDELRYFAPLLKQIPPEEIEWSCYFSKLPKNTRVLGVNRAGYSVFAEVPLGAGKLVMLPRFKDRTQAATIIVNEIIPRMIHEEEVTFVPKWLPDFSSPFEKLIRSTIGEIERAKRLLFTKDKGLKKAVAFAFEKLGFEVEILPDGTLPDLRVADGEQKAIVEVKGHEKRQATRRDVLQLIGYLSETDIEEKGIVVSNHEFKKEPRERNEKAFTAGAIQLGEKMEVSLVSTINLYEIVMKILEKKLNRPATKKIRGKIMAGSGTVQLS